MNLFRIKRPGLLCACVFILSTILFSMKLYALLVVISMLYAAHIILSVVSKSIRGVILSSVCLFLVLYPVIFTAVTDININREHKRTKNLYFQISADILEVDPQDDGAILTVALDGRYGNVKTALFIDSKILPRRFGKIIFDGNIVEAGTDDTLFYSENQLRARSIGFVCKPDKYSIIPPERVEQQGLIRKACITIDNKFRNVFPESAGTDTLMYAKALITGDRSLFSQKTNDVFTRSGLMPYLCISGLHVMLASAILERLMLFFGLRPGARAAIGSLFLILLIFIAGGGGSVVRASIMSGCYLIFRALRVDADKLSVLALSMLILMLINPYNIFLAGVQMSYLATLGVLISLYLGTYTKRAFGALSSFVMSVNTSFMAQGFVTPILASSFDGVFLLSVFSNITAGVIFTPMMFLVIVAAILTFLPWHFPLFCIAQLIKLFMMTFEKLAEFFVNFEFFFASPDRSGVLYVVFTILLTIHLYCAICLDNKALMRSAVALASVSTVIITVLHIITITV